MSRQTDILLVANSMADKIESNGLEYSTNFQRADLIESLKPGIESSMTATVDMLISIFTNAAPVVDNSGAGLQASILSLLNTYKG